MILITYLDFLSFYMTKQDYYALLEGSFLQLFKNWPLKFFFGLIDGLDQE